MRNHANYPDETSLPLPPTPKKFQAREAAAWAKLAAQEAAHEAAVNAWLASREAARTATTEAATT